MTLTILEQMQALAAERGGVCISEITMERVKKYLLRCGEPGHPLWAARKDSLLRGSWCPACGKKRMTGRPSNLDAWMQAHKLELLTRPYESAMVIHTWRCSLGHEFSKMRRDITGAISKGKAPCPECARRRKWLAGQT